MKENLDLIEQICGTKAPNEELIEIASDPNFVFTSDPSFTTLNLWNTARVGILELRTPVMGTVLGPATKSS